MKTIITEIIDGYTIIKKFDNAIIDPVNTNKIVKEEIQKTEEYKNFDTKLRYSKNIYNMAKKALSEARLLSQQKNFKKQTGKLKPDEELNLDNTITLRNADYNRHMGRMDAIEVELKNLEKDLKQKRKDLTIQNAVHFEPRTGEEFIPGDELLSLQEKFINLQSNEILARTGEILPDNRGIIYWQFENNEWKKTKITKIGINLPSDAIIEANLTTEQKTEITNQIEAKRIENLSPTEKENEKQTAINSIANEATIMRSRLEIQGETEADALSQSQDWYNEQLAIIETKYI
jgi:hypothetical protein